VSSRGCCSGERSRGPDVAAGSVSRFVSGSDHMSTEASIHVNYIVTLSVYKQPHINTEISSMTCQTGSPSHHGDCSARLIEIQHSLTVSNDSRKYMYIVLLSTERFARRLTVLRLVSICFSSDSILYARSPIALPEGLAALARPGPGGFAAMILLSCRHWIFSCSILIFL